MGFCVPIDGLEPRAANVISSLLALNMVKDNGGGDGDGGGGVAVALLLLCDILASAFGSSCCRTKVTDGLQTNLDF